MPKSYHFSLGDSSAAPIGFCARIVANSKAEALQLLRDSLPEELDAGQGLNSSNEYIMVYFNEDAISEADIDEEEDEEEDEEADGEE